MATSVPLTSTQCAQRASSANSCDGHAVCTRCLQQKGCMIATYGDCVSYGYDDYVDKYTNFTLAFARGLALPDALLNASAPLSARQYWQFKWGDVTYCPSGDATCDKCIAQNFYSDLPYADSRFCVGDSGCVCIFNCESRCGTFAPAATATTTYEPSTPSPVETSPSVTTISPSSPSDDGDLSIAQVMRYLIGPLLVVTCMIMGSSRRRRREREAQEQLPAITEDSSTLASPTERAPSVYLQAASAPEPIEAPATRPAQLELYGWISHRQNLIDTEQRRLRGYEDVIPWWRLQTPAQANQSNAS